MIQRHAAIEVEGLEKTFRVPKQHIHTIKERALHPFRRTEYDVYDVLRGVSFDIGSGEFFGIVGRNGSGKSTLLKCLAGIYRADNGKIRVAGRLAPFIELGVGFNPDLTALDNVVLNAVMMGLSPKEARERFDAVMAFAELEDFLDMKLKNYSSGMQVRLAFSVMVQVDADVLLIDEVLAVGDAAFQQKCFDVFYRLRDEGRTIVLVTHQMPMIEQFSHRALLLNEGRIDVIGDPSEVARRYLDLNLEHIETEPTRSRATAARPIDAWVSDAEGHRLDAVTAGEPLVLTLEVDVRERVESPYLGLWLQMRDGTRLFYTGTNRMEELPDAFEAGERVVLRVRMETPLRAGRYFIGAELQRKGAHNDYLFAEPHVGDFTVVGDAFLGLLSLEHEIELEHDLERTPQ
jgi:ABC-type polysaccharide/polyol phosphate transport system ATPase subunit